MGICRKFLVNLLDGTNCSREGTSVVVTVEGIEQGAVFTYQSNFCGGGTSIDT